VARVARDLDKAMRFSRDTSGIDPWGVYWLSPPDVRGSTVRRKPTDLGDLVALTDLPAGVRRELLQPVKAADSQGTIWRRKARASPTRGFTIPIIRRPWRVTSRPRMSGKHGEDEFCCLDEKRVFGAVIELGNAGRIRGRCPA